MNKNRGIIYERRQKILERIASEEKEGAQTTLSSLHDDIVDNLKKEADAIVSLHAPKLDSNEWDFKEMYEAIAAIHEPFRDTATEAKLKSFQDRELLQAFLRDLFLKYYEDKCAKADTATVNRAETVITLRSIDQHWMDHIDDMSHLREQVAFAGYAQRDPLIEYQDQGFRRFQQLLTNIQSTIVRMLLQAQFADFEPRVIAELEEEDEFEDAMTNEDQIEAELTETGVSKSIAPQGAQRSVLEMQPGDTPHRAPPSKPQPSKVSHVGRNDPCPCGSGKKYKKCHGKSE